MNVYNKFYISILVYILLSYTASARANDALSESQFMTMLNTCAAGSKSEFKGDLIGSVQSLYQGEGTKGSATFSTETEFLKRLPEAQKFEGYRLYVECIKAIVSDPTKNRAKIQYDLLENIRKDTPYLKIIEAYGQPTKIKKLFTDSKPLRVGRAHADLRYFKGVEVDVIIGYAQGQNLLGIGVYAPDKKDKARIPYLNMGVSAEGNKPEKNYSRLSDVTILDLTRICDLETFSGGHARFGYLISPYCYFGAPGGYMNFEFVYQPGEKDFSGCNINAYDKIEVKRSRCRGLLQMKPDLGFVYFNDELPKEMTDTIMEWIYDFAQ